MVTTPAKELALQLWEEGWNQGHLDAVDRALAPDARDRHDRGDDDFRGHLKTVIGQFRAGFGDLHATVEDIIAEDDRLAMRVVLTGTHDGWFFGHSPTGHKIRVEQFHFLRVNSHGQGVRHWANTGIDELLRQLAPTDDFPT
jgi:predicted ester cyclase